MWTWKYTACNFSENVCTDIINPHRFSVTRHEPRKRVVKIVSPPRMRNLSDCHFHRVHCSSRSSSTQLNLVEKDDFWKISKKSFLRNFPERKDLLVAQHFSTKMKIVGKLPGCSDFCNCSLALERKLELEIICTRVCVGSGRGTPTMQLHMRRVLQNHKCL